VTDLTDLTDLDDLMQWKRAQEAAHRITVGELRAALAVFSADDEITFSSVGGDLDPLVYRRVSQRSPRSGPGLACIELDELTDDATRMLYVVEPEAG
jgi:hypothetical protein